MKITRHHAAAALFAACFASSAFAAGGPGAGQDAGRWGGPAGAHHGWDGPEGGHHGWGEHRHGRHGREHGGLFRRLHRLNLSEAQRDKLFNIRHAAEPEFRERMKAVRKAHVALAELARAERFDDAKAAALSRELGQAVAAQALLRARTEAQAMAVLSPEQRDQLRRHRTPGPQMRPRAPQDMPDAKAPPRQP